ncbi:stigma-specific STIG1 family protein [Tanacetum coccineum]
MKEDVGNVPVWVKIHVVPMTAFSEDGLSAIATKLGTPLILDSYTSDICIQSWGRSSYAKTLIEIQADVDMSGNLLGVHVTKVFGHVQDECLKNIGSGVVKNLKKPSQTPRGILVGPKVGFKLAKQVYRTISKKPNANTSRNKKKHVEPTKEVSNSTPFDVLNSVENDVDLGTNGGTSNLASKKANSSGSFFWNVESSITSTTPIVEKIDKTKRLIIDRKVTLVDDEGKPFIKRLILRVIMIETYENADYEYDPYNDDMYKGQEISDKIQSLCDNLDIKVRGRFACAEYEAWFLESKRERGRGVKEKESVFIDDSTKVNHHVDEVFAGNIAPITTNANNVKTDNVNMETPLESNKGYDEKSNGDTSKKSVNFRTLITPARNGADVVVLLESIRVVSERFANSAYGFFLGKRVAWPVAANYVRNTWSKYGLVKSMLNSSNGLFFFQFSFKDGLDVILENGPLFIRNNPLIVRKWDLDVNLLKEDVGNVPV